MPRSPFALALALALLLVAPAALAAEPTPEQAAFEEDLVDALGGAAPSSDGDASGRLGDDRMRKANRAAAEILRQRMQADRPGELQLLRQAAQAEIIVVSGQYDRVQDVLRAIDVRHVVIPPSCSGSSTCCPPRR